MQIVKFEKDKILTKSYYKNELSNEDFIEYDNIIFSEHYSSELKYIIQAWAPVDDEPSYYIFILKDSQLLKYWSYKKIDTKGEPTVYNRY